MGRIRPADTRPSTSSARRGAARRRGSLIGLLCWPGVLLYLLYVYAFYLIGVPFNALFLVYLTLVTLNVYALIGLVASIDGDAVRQRFTARAPVRIIGGVLVVLAFLFIARTVFAVVTVLTSHAAIDSMVFASWISDCAVQCPALIIGGILLWRRDALGYVVGAGLLLQLGVLFAGLPVSLMLGALLTGSPVDASSAVILPFGVILFILLAFFVRAAVPGRSLSLAS